MVHSIAYSLYSLQVMFVWHRIGSTGNNTKHIQLTHKYMFYLLLFRFVSAFDSDGLWVSTKASADRPHFLLIENRSHAITMISRRHSQFDMDPYCWMNAMQKASTGRLGIKPTRIRCGTQIAEM
jgi:hypothetical protein